MSGGSILCEFRGSGCTKLQLNQVEYARDQLRNPRIEARRLRAFYQRTLRELIRDLKALRDPLALAEPLTTITTEL